MLENEITDDDILQGIIGAIGDLDAPSSPDQKGYSSLVQYLIGESAADRQRWRQQILGTSACDFKDFAKRLENLTLTGSVAVVGSKSALESANKVIETQKLNISSAY